MNGRTRQHASTPTAAISPRRWSWTRSAGAACSAAARYQPPDAPLSRGLEVHPGGAGETWSSGSTARYVPAGYGWSFPAGDEMRIGVGSFDPRFHVKDTTVLLAEDLAREPVRYQGNWIPHRLRAPPTDGVFFVGDSAGHCLPLTAEGIRTALYFGIACGRELRGVVEGRQSIASALARYGDFSRVPPLEVRGAAGRPEAGPARAAAPPAPLDRGDAGEALRRLELRPLPGDRAAGVRDAGTPARARRAPERIAA